MQLQFNFTFSHIYLTALVVLLTWASLAQGAGESYEVLLSFVILMRRFDRSYQSRFFTFQTRSWREGRFPWYRCL